MSRKGIHLAALALLLSAAAPAAALPDGLPNSVNARCPAGHGYAGLYLDYGDPRGTPGPEDAYVCVGVEESADDPCPAGGRQVDVHSSLASTVSLCVFTDCGLDDPSPQDWCYPAPYVEAFPTDPRPACFGTAIARVWFTPEEYVDACV